MFSVHYKVRRFAGNNRFMDQVKYQFDEYNQTFEGKMSSLCSYEGRCPVVDALAKKHHVGEGCIVICGFFPNIEITPPIPLPRKTKTPQ